MIRTIEASIDENGDVHLEEPVKLDGPHRALVLVIDDQPTNILKTARFSEEALGRDWNTPEEDEAWSHLQ